MNLKTTVLAIYLLFSELCLHAQEKLIPLPISTVWEEGTFNLDSGIQIEIENTTLQNEYRLAEELFTQQNIRIYRGKHKKGIPSLKLQQAPATTESAEAYALLINKNGVTISASSAVGIFYGLQTLKQFNFEQSHLPFSFIKDEPAFPWRAFLVDVGRNYQPLDMLKEQIDIMSKYKLNVLHFHFTEDIAWRLASKKHPRLTEASNMTRWPGQYYTEAEFKELIDYCAERHILLLPEIDMPGHSKAFERHFGFNMQSDSGIYYIKELLKEFSETYPGLPYLHIGGDEVKITNQNFMPEITEFVEKLGYKTVGWDPGSNLIPQTTRQLWMGGPDAIKEEGKKTYIDSKHLYINHMDPLETITTLFHRKIGLQNKAHNNLLGATLCSWPDRAVSEPLDMFYQSAIYPAILTFAERTWRGGGEGDWKCNIMPNHTSAYSDFKEFENRLLHHKDVHFKNLPFPYFQQTGKYWKLIGPFHNEGNLSADFTFDIDTVTSFINAEGGTIIMRHWWADIIQGAIPEPEQNTTWYAFTELWSDTEEAKNFWVGFNDLSRSYASNSPSLGTWDSRSSKVFVNGKEVLPPRWRQADQEGDLENPMIDEGYSFREPISIPLKKGINKVLIKLPVGSFKGKDWQNPEKWMFTFLEIE